MIWRRSFFLSVSFTLLVSFVSTSVTPAFALRPPQKESKSGLEELGDKLHKVAAAAGIPLPDLSGLEEPWSGGPRLRLGTGREDDHQAVIHGFGNSGNRIRIELTERHSNQGTLTFLVDRPDGTRPDAEVIIFSGASLNKYFQRAVDEQSQTQWGKLWDPETGTLREGVTGPVLQSFLRSNPVLLSQLKQKKESLIALRKEREARRRLPQALGLNFRQPGPGAQRPPERVVFMFDVSSPNSSEWKPLLYMNANLDLPNSLLLTFLAPRTVQIDRETVFDEKQQKLAGTAPATDQNAGLEENPTRELIRGLFYPGPDGSKDQFHFQLIRYRWRMHPDHVKMPVEEVAKYLLRWLPKEPKWTLESVQALLQKPFATPGDAATLIEQVQGYLAVNYPDPATRQQQLTDIKSRNSVVQAISEGFNRNERPGGALENAILFILTEPQTKRDDPKSQKELLAKIQETLTGLEEERRLAGLEEKIAPENVRVLVMVEKALPRTITIEVIRKQLSAHGVESEQVAEVVDLGMLGRQLSRLKSEGNSPTLVLVGTPRSDIPDSQRQRNDLLTSATTLVDSDFGPSVPVVGFYMPPLLSKESESILEKSLQSFVISRLPSSTGLEERTEKYTDDEGWSWLEGVMQLVDIGAITSLTWPGRTLSGKGQLTSKNIREAAESVAIRNPESDFKWEIEGKKLSLSAAPAAPDSHKGSSAVESLMGQLTWPERVLVFMGVYESLFRSQYKDKGKSDPLRGLPINLDHPLAEHLPPKNANPDPVDIQIRLKTVEKLLSGLALSEEIDKPLEGGFSLREVFTAAQQAVNEAVEKEKAAKSGLEERPEGIILGPADLFKKGDILISRVTGKRSFEVGADQKSTVSDVTIRPIVKTLEQGRPSFPAAELRMGYSVVRWDRDDAASWMILSGNSALALIQKLLEQTPKQIIADLGYSYWTKRVVSELTPGMARNILTISPERHLVAISSGGSVALIRQGELESAGGQDAADWYKGLAEHAKQELTPEHLQLARLSAGLEETTTPDPEKYARDIMELIRTNGSKAVEFTLRTYLSYRDVKTPPGAKYHERFKQTVVGPRPHQLWITRSFDVADVNDQTVLEQVRWLLEGQSWNMSQVSSDDAFVYGELRFGQLKEANVPTLVVFNAIVNPDSATISPATGLEENTPVASDASLDYVGRTSGLEKTYRLTGRSREFTFSGMLAGTPLPLPANDILASHEVRDELPAKITLGRDQTVLIQWSLAPSLNRQTSRFIVVRRVGVSPSIQVLGQQDGQFVVSDFVTSQERKDYDFAIPRRLQVLSWDAATEGSRVEVVREIAGRKVVIPIDFDMSKGEMIVHYSELLSTGGRFIVHQLQSAAGLEEGSVISSRQDATTLISGRIARGQTTGLVLKDLNGQVTTITLDNEQFPLPAQRELRFLSALASIGGDPKRIRISGTDGNETIATLTAVPAAGLEEGIRTLLIVHPRQDRLNLIKTEALKWHPGLEIKTLRSAVELQAYLDVGEPMPDAVIVDFDTVGIGALNGIPSNIPTGFLGKGVYRVLEYLKVLQSDDASFSYFLKERGTRDEESLKIARTLFDSKRPVVGLQGHFLREDFTQLFSELDRLKRQSAGLEENTWRPLVEARSPVISVAWNPRPGHEIQAALLTQDGQVQAYRAGGDRHVYSRDILSNDRNSPPALSSPILGALRVAFRLSGSGIFVGGAEGGVTYDAYYQTRSRQHPVRLGETGIHPTELPPGGAALSPDRKRLLVAAGNGRATIWNMAPEDENQFKSLDETQPVGRVAEVTLDRGNISAVAYGHQGVFALGTVEGGIEIHRIEIQTVQPIVTLQKHEAPITAMRFSPSRKYFASADRAGKVILWDAETWAPLHEMHHPAGSAVYALEFNGRHEVERKSDQLKFRMLALASAGEDGVIRFWDHHSGELQSELTIQPGVRINALAFSWDGTRLIAGLQQPVAGGSYAVMAKVPAKTGLEEIPAYRVSRPGYEGPVVITGKIGGTQLELEVGTAEGLLTDVPGVKVPTLEQPGERTQDQILDRWAGLMVDLIRQVGSHRVIKVEMSAPGAFKPDGTLLWDQENIPGIQKGLHMAQALQARVARLLGEERDPFLGEIPVKVEHDGTRHAKGEMSLFGKFPNAPKLFFVGVGTGIATRGIFKEPFLGDDRVQFLANEVPHFLIWNPETGLYELQILEHGGIHPNFTDRTLPPDDRPNPLYQREDLEDRTSGPGIGRALAAQLRSDLAVPERLLWEAPAPALEIVNALIEHGHQDIAEKLRPGRPEELTVSELSILTEVSGKLAAGETPNELARSVFETRGRELGSGIATILVKFSQGPLWPEEFQPEEMPIVVGGGVSQVGDFYLKAVKEGFDQTYQFYLAHPTGERALPRLSSEQIHASNILVDSDREKLAGLPTPEEVAEHQRKLEVLRTPPVGFGSWELFRQAVGNLRSDSADKLVLPAIPFGQIAGVLLQAGVDHLVLQDPRGAGNDSEIFPLPPTLTKTAEIFAQEARLLGGESVAGTDFKVSILRERQPSQIRAVVSAPAPLATGLEGLGRALQNFYEKYVFWSARSVDLKRERFPVLVDASKDPRMDRLALALSVMLARDKIPELDFQVVMPAAREPELQRQLQSIGVDEVFLKQHFSTYEADSAIEKVREEAEDKLAERLLFFSAQALRDSGRLYVAEKWSEKLAENLRAFFIEGGLDFITEEVYGLFKAVLESA